MANDSKPIAKPRIRFPEFQRVAGWSSRPLSAIAEPVTERAKNGDGSKVLTLSGEHGIVLQTEYFGKQIAGINSERYIKIDRNDFVYNDRTTKMSPYGTIKRLSNYEGGIVSPIYKCFRFGTGENPTFWEFYFESGIHNAELKMLINEGARAGRFNISIDKFLSTRGWRPEKGEQNKIANCLTSLDEVIAAQKQKVQAMKAYKRGLMGQLFPGEGETLPRLRFPEFRKADAWIKNRVGSIAIILKGKGIAKSDVVIDGERPCIRYGELYTRYNEVIDAVYSMTNAPASELFLSQKNDVIIPASGETKLDIAKASCVIQGDVALGSDLNVLRSSLNGVFLSYLLNGPKRYEIARISQGDAVVHLYPSQLEELIVTTPPLPEEQQKIAYCLVALDTRTSAESEKLDALKDHKKGLMQQLYPSPEGI